MPSRPRRQFTTDQRVTVRRWHLFDKVPVSALCEAYDLQPSGFYAWQAQAFAAMRARPAVHGEDALQQSGPAAGAPRGDGGGAAPPAAPGQPQRGPRLPHRRSSPSRSRAGGATLACAL